MAIYLTFDDFDKIHLIISTDEQFTAVEIIKRFSVRFNVEHLINQLKNTFCLKDIWIQNPRTYCRMMYLKLWSIVITQLSVVSNEAEIKNYIKEHMPWRIKSNGSMPVIAGIAQDLLNEHFRHMSCKSFLSKVSSINSVQQNEQCSWQL